MRQHIEYDFPTLSNMCMRVQFVLTCPKSQMCHKITFTFITKVNFSFECQGSNGKCGNKPAKILGSGQCPHGTSQR